MLRSALCKHRPAAVRNVTSSLQMQCLCAVCLHYVIACLCCLYLVSTAGCVGFAGVQPGISAAAQTAAAELGDPALADVLLAWYNAGYAASQVWYSMYLFAIMPVAAPTRVCPLPPAFCVGVLCMATIGYQYLCMHCAVLTILS